MIKLIIEGTLVNLNDYTNACRMNRYCGAEMKEKTEAKITAHIKEQLRGVHIHKPVRLSFKWYEPNRKRDLDNICFAKKFILDALVKNDVLVNDGWRWVKGFTDEFYLDKEKPRVEVEIEWSED